MKPASCIHRAGCPKPDVCAEVGHCTSQTREGLEQEKAFLSSNLQTPGEISREIERRLMVAVMEADDAFEKAGATGTKTWIREFLLNRLEANGLGIGMKDRLPSAPETPCEPAEEIRLLMRAHKQLTRYAPEDPMAEEIAKYIVSLPVGHAVKTNGDPT